MRILFRTPLVSALLLCLSACPVLAQESDAGRDPARLLDPGSVPAHAEFAEAFAPAGWIVEQALAGELNGDGNPDLILTLVEDLLPSEDGAPNLRVKALLFALGGAGGYDLAGVGPRALLCSTCYGMLGGPEGGASQIEVHGDVVWVNDLFGSRDAENLTLKYRFDADLGGFRLIGRDAVFFDRLTAASVNESTNFLTGLSIVEVSTMNPETEEESVTSRRMEGEARTILVRDVDVEALASPLFPALHPAME